MDPEPIRRVLADGLFEPGIDLRHQVFGGAEGAVRSPVGNGILELDPPLGEAGPVTDPDPDRHVMAEGIDGGSGGGGAGDAEEWDPEAVGSGVLVSQQAEQDVPLGEDGEELGSVAGPFEEEGSRL